MRRIQLAPTCQHLFSLFDDSAGYPLITYFTTPKLSTQGGFNLGGTNRTGQIPDIPGNWGLVDKDTPSNVRTRFDYRTGKTWQLVFSDEFNTDGRTFYPGDDPFWEAVDLWYGSTQDLEWYDPAQVTTQGGALVITMESVTDVTLNHGLQYKSGMLQSWNKFCFTTGYIEVSITLPGPNSDTQGYVSIVLLSYKILAQSNSVAWRVDDGQPRPAGLRSDF